MFEEKIYKRHKIRWKVDIGDEHSEFFFIF